MDRSDQQAREEQVCDFFSQDVEKSSKQDYNIFVGEQHSLAKGVINMKKRVAIYCRLSEEDKNKQNATDDSGSIQNQKAMLVDHAERMEWEIYDIYSDDDYAGADRNRPEFKRLIADAQATAALVRERLMSIPVRVSGLCEGRTARDIEEILEDAINDVLKSFQKSEYIT